MAMGERLDLGWGKGWNGDGERLDLGWEKGWNGDGGKAGFVKEHGMEFPNLPKFPSVFPWDFPSRNGIRRCCRMDAASIPEVFPVGLKDGVEQRDFSTFVELSVEYEGSEALLVCVFQGKSRFWEFRVLK